MNDRCVRFSYFNKKLGRRREAAMLYVIDYFAKPLKVTQCHWKWYHLKLGYTIYYSHSIVTVSLSRVISEIKQDIGWKSRIFYTQPGFDAHCGDWGSPFEYGN